MTNSLPCKSDKSWTVLNEVEQAWTGVEESDRTSISNLAYSDRLSLATVCLLR